MQKKKQIEESLSGKRGQDSISSWNIIRQTKPGRLMLEMVRLSQFTQRQYGLNGHSSPGI